MDASFVDHLKNALNNLYNLKTLAGNPLGGILGLPDTADRPVLLQRRLKDAVADLKPKYGEPRSSNTWQVYELLSLRYIQQFSQKEVAAQLGISISKLNRLQQAAIEMLAVALVERYGLADNNDSALSPDEVAEAAPGGERSDYAWAAVPSPEKKADLAHTLQAVMRLVAPLISRYPIRFEQHLEAGLPETHVYPLALQQILINTITTAVHYLQGGVVCLSAAQQGSNIIFSLEGKQAPGAVPEPGVLHADLQVNLEAARNLAMVSGGSLLKETSAGEIKVVVTLPSVARIPILVVDDSDELIQLLTHYVQNTPFQLFREQDPLQAVARAEETGAQIVVIDVMMPRLDGWNLLQYLRNAPGLSGVRVVVSSILRQEELALSLGADAFLPKPIQREAFLALLGRLASPRVEKPD